jgi:hypothetical protein
MNFQEYCKYGYVNDVKRLLKYPRCNPPAQNNKALRDAINYNKLQVVKLLFEDGRADFTVDDYTPIAYLAKKKQFKLVEEALNRYNLTYDIKNGIIIKYVIESKNIKYFNKIINEIKNVDCFEILNTAVLSKNKEISNIILNKFKCDYSKNYELFFKLSKLLNNEDLLSTLLHDKNYKNTVKAKRVIKYMLTSLKVNTLNNNLFKILLNESFFYTAAFNDYDIMSRVITTNNLDIIEYYFNHEQFDIPNTIKQNSYKITYLFNQVIQDSPIVTEILKIILNRLKINSNEFDEIIRYSLLYKRQENTQVLMHDERANISYFENKYLQYCIANEDINEINFILNHVKFDPKIGLSKYINKASKKLKIFNLLIESPIILNYIKKTRFSKIPSIIKFYLAAKSDIKSDEELEKVFNVL